MNAPSTKSQPSWWERPIGRRAFFGWGVGLMALKYNVDRWVVASQGRSGWFWERYWNPFATPLSALTGEQVRLALTLLAIALPFVAVGVGLTLRRLRSVGWPWWLALLFFVPGANVVVFALLCAIPDARADEGPSVSQPGRRGMARVLSRLGVRSALSSALAATVFTVALAVPAVVLCSKVFESFGWGVFVALPVALGLSAALVHSAVEHRPASSCIGVGLLSLGLCAAALLIVAVEGVLCLVMAAPLAAPLTVLGALIGYSAQTSAWRANSGRLLAVGWLPFLATVGSERLVPPTPEEIAAVSVIEVDAPPETVWQHVVTFSDLPEPSDWVFSTGIAYPVRARIVGEGVGAIRTCEFSTGAFVEPITAWDAPRRLAFDVQEQPHPMRELSLYRNLDTPHLEGFFRSHRGQFQLLELPGNRTRLEGTTWYSQRFWPAGYWRLWSDFLIHRIHGRVLSHIKAEAEAEPTRRS